MKKVLFFLLVLIVCTTNLFSQEWAPVGSKWTYSFSSWGFPNNTNSPVSLTCVGDTMIQNQSCRIIRGYLTCSFVSNSAYMYFENGKIYMYVDSVVGFHILYDFKAHVGNSWTIIAPGHHVGDTSTIMVDAIVTKIFEGDTFSVQYVHNFNEYDRWVFPGYIIKNIGNVACFFPLFSTCDPWTGPIRCYEDSTKKFVFSDLSCDTVIYYNVNEYPKKDLIKISPNPFTSSTQIALDKTYHNISLAVYDIQGKLMLQKQYEDCSQIQLNRNGLDNGMYFLKLTMDEKWMETGKIVISE